MISPHEAIKSKIVQRALDLPAAVGEGFWADKQRALRQHFQQDPVDKFLEWSTVVATMFVGEADYIVEERAWLRSLPRWHTVLSMSEYGGYPNSNLAHQAYHLAQWELATGLQVESMRSILEVGGGYGAMLRVVRMMGFKGPYTIYDLPEVSLLQKFYSEQYALDVYLVAGRPRVAVPDLLIGLWSISEMLPEDRQNLLYKVEPNHYLMAAGEERPDMAERWPRSSSSRVVIPHMSNNYYLVS